MKNWKTLTPEKFFIKSRKEPGFEIDWFLLKPPWVLEAKGEKERKERMAVLRYKQDEQ